MHSGRFFSLLVYIRNSVQPLCERVVACKFFLCCFFFALSSQEKERRFVSDSAEKPQNVVALGACNVVKVKALLGLQGVD